MPCALSLSLSLAPPLAATCPSSPPRTDAPLAPAPCSYGGLLSSGGYNRFDQLAQFVESDEFNASAFAFGTESSGGYGRSGSKGKGKHARNDGLLTHDFDGEGFGGGLNGRSGFGMGGEKGRGGGGSRGGGGRSGGGKGKGGGSKRANADGSGGVADGGAKRVRLTLCGHSGSTRKAGVAKGGGGGGNGSTHNGSAHHGGSQNGINPGGSSLLGGSPPGADVNGLGGLPGNGSSGDLGGLGAGGAPSAAARAPPKRRAWLSETDEKAELNTVRYPQSAASARLLKQLADFNPSGSGDATRNALLPNEHDAKERGEQWRLTPGGCPADLVDNRDEHPEHHHVNGGLAGMAGMAGMGGGGGMDGGGGHMHASRCLSTGSDSHQALLDMEDAIALHDGLVGCHDGGLGGLGASRSSSDNGTSSILMPPPPSGGSLGFHRDGGYMGGETLRRDVSLNAVDVLSIMGASKPKPTDGGFMGLPKPSGGGYMGLPKPSGGGYMGGQTLRRDVSLNAVDALSIMGAGSGKPPFFGAGSSPVSRRQSRESDGGLSSPGGKIGRRLNSDGSEQAMHVLGSPALHVLGSPPILHVLGAGAPDVADLPSPLQALPGSSASPACLASPLHCGSSDGGDPDSHRRASRLSSLGGASYLGEPITPLPPSSLDDDGVNGLRGEGLVLVEDVVAEDGLRGEHHVHLGHEPPHVGNDEHVDAADSNAHGGSAGEADVLDAGMMACDPPLPASSNEPPDEPTDGGADAPGGEGPAAGGGPADDLMDVDVGA